MRVEGDGVGPVHAGQLAHKVVAQLGLDEEGGLGTVHALFTYTVHSTS